MGAPKTATLLIALAVVGCAAPRVRPAPFRARPDTVQQGDLRGPFSGRVVDADNGRAVAGAIVYATWTIERGYGLVEPAGFRERVTSTDADGFYTVARLGDGAADDQNTRVTDFYLVVYKRGYVAYRSDRRFADLGPRLDFAQRGNEIALERWRGDLSHAKHLRYIGGGTAIASLTSWEAEEAARELSGDTADGGRMVTDPFGRGRTPADAAAAVVAARLLHANEIVKLTGFEGEFETGPLGDEPDTAEYSSMHLRALDRPESFDIALRLWKLPADEAAERYRELADTLPGARERNELADRSLRASEGEIRGFAYLDERRGAVVLITCGIAQCRAAEDAAALARRSYELLENIWPVGVAP
jgi:hypothetical protein